MVIEQLEIHRWKRKEEEKAEGDGEEEEEEPWLKFDFLYKN